VKEKGRREKKREKQGERPESWRSRGEDEMLRE
jgi:hypothetical protein